MKPSAKPEAEWSELLLTRLGGPDRVQRGQVFRADT